MPITKHNFIVKDVNNLADTIRRAFRIAKTGRPGPVLVDITKDVTANKADYSKIVPISVKRSTKDIREEDIEKAVTLIKKSKKPYIFVGGGAVISDADKSLKEFVPKVDAPVADTLMGKDAYNGEDPLYTGMLGMHGTKTSNLGVTECDLLIIIGARFSDRVIGNSKKFVKNAKVLQIDVDPVEINKNIVTYSSIIGDIRVVLEKLNAKLEKQEHKEWIQRIMDLKEKFPLHYTETKLCGPEIVEKIYEITKGDAIISTEVGQHQMWTAQIYKFKIQEIIKCKY